MNLIDPKNPVPLSGSRVRLEPLSFEHHWKGLLAIGLEVEIWRWMLDDIRTEGDLRRHVESALSEQSTGESIPYATVDLPTGRVAGCTRFLNISNKHRRVEIGWTWVGLPFQRTHVNTEAKYLMLRHAFETWKCIRVEFKANSLNERSRKAMLRIGCTEEGILRRHMIRENGIVRDTVYYSTLDHEWPTVRSRLEKLLERQMV